MTKPYTEITFTGTPEEIEAQWLEARKKGIGGSDAAAILGLNKYSTPLTVWLDKTGQSQDEFNGNEATYWGNKLEEVVAQEFSTRHPECTVKESPAILRSKEHTFMQASLDRIIKCDDGDGVLEIKTCGAHRKDDWDSGVPDYYLPQVTHYLAVTGFEFAYVAVLIGGQEYREYKIERDEEDIQYLVDKEIEFWGYVHNLVPPEPLHHKADAAALAKIHSEHDGQIVDLVEIPELDELQDLKAKREKLDERIDELNNKLRAQIGNSKGIQTSSKRVVWVRSTATKFDTKKFRADHAELAEEYSSEYKRDGGLRITYRKED